MKKYLPIIIIAVVVLAGGGLVLSRNNKNDNSNNSSNGTDMAHSESTSTDQSANSSTNEVAAATDKVSIENFNFTPAKITVKMGTKVTWTNNDSVAHTVTADSGTGPKSDNISPGGTYSYTFDSVGNFAYHCNIHPDMTGSVTVTQ
jgi:plastocyanin